MTWRPSGSLGIGYGFILFPICLSAYHGSMWLQIERERADLSVQLIGMTDRLEDAEGSTDAQVRREDLD